MNTTSEKAAKPAFAALLSLLLVSCLQGPWEYLPEVKENYRGLWLWGYAVAERPIDGVCIERMIELDEEHTPAFAFYETATVSITGNFGTGDTTVLLQANDLSPNCFAAPSTLLPRAGEEYRLQAGITWDSSGSIVSTAFSATASIPDTFHIGDSARATAMVETGGSFSLGGDLAGQVASFPPDVQQTLLLEFGNDLLELQGDSAALMAYLEANGERIQRRVIELLEANRTLYEQGDTVYYLGGALNTLSHYYHGRYSDDVGGVLVTMRFDTTQGKPITRFDSFFGMVPDTADFYYRGPIKRLLSYPRYTSNDGRVIFDSIPVVNSWFHSGLNRLYFYGVEQDYADYITTAIENAGDSRILPAYNVQGASGYFVGAVLDSFDFYLKVDSNTLNYPMQVAKANWCSDRGWQSREDCRDFYPEYCKSNAWRGSDCNAEVIRLCIERQWQGLDDSEVAQWMNDLGLDSLGMSREKSAFVEWNGFVKDTTGLQLSALCSVRADSAYADTLARQEGKRLYCIENGFPAAFPDRAGLAGTCAPERESCFGSAGENSCKEQLWSYCLDRAWRPEICALGMVSYCKERPLRSEILCSRADAFCRDNPEEFLCRL